MRSVLTTEVKILPYRPTELGKYDVYYMAKQEKLKCKRFILADILCANGDETFGQDKFEITGRYVSLASLID